MATPTPSSNSRTKPSTKEAGCGCQATVIELFSALQSSARILGTPGAVKNSAQQNIQIQLHPVYCCQPRHLFKVGVASDRTAYNTIVCPRVLLVFPFFSWRLIVYYTATVSSQSESAFACVTRMPSSLPVIRLRVYPS